MRTLSSTIVPIHQQNQNNHRNRRSHNSNNRHNRQTCHNHNHNHSNDINNVNETENLLYSYAKKYKLCYFHLLNQCKYGQECQFIHGLACERCHKNVFNPLLPIQNQIIDHKKFCNSHSREENLINEFEFEEISIINNNDNVKFESDLSSQINTTSLNPKAKEFQSKCCHHEELPDTGCHQESSLSNLIDFDENDEISFDHQFPVVECGICYEKISSTNGDKTLGLLANCNHVFCYNCIKKWRSTVLNLSSVKSCPLCRKISFYIIPSSIYPKNEEEKNLIITEYRKSRMKIRCKYYRYPEHQFCPFGDECFYAHLLPNGERAVLGPPHVQLEYRSSRNTDLHYISQSEEWWNSEVLRQIREIIEASSFDDHDIQTLLSTLSQIILISEGGRAFREPETILHIRHNNNTNNNNSNGNGNSSEVTVSVESPSSYYPSSQVSSPVTPNSGFSSSPRLNQNSTHTNCNCPCHHNGNSNQSNPLLSNLNNTITAINNSNEIEKDNNNDEKEDYKNNKK